MKKQVLRVLLSLFLAFCVMIPVTGTVDAADEGFEFMEEVTYELPQVIPGSLIINDVSLPSPGADGFITDLSGPMPALRTDGLLAQPSAPLPQLPAPGKLLVDSWAEPEEGAQPISTVEDLKLMKQGGSFYLTNDIDMSGVEWEPLSINLYSDDQFLTLDGQGYAIRNLTLKNTDNTGLFRFVYTNFTVRNLLIEDTVIPAGCSGGIIAAGVSGSLVMDNVAVRGYTIDTSNVTSSGGDFGFLVGSASYKTLSFTSCLVEGNLSVSEPVEPEGFQLFETANGFAAQISADDLTIRDCMVFQSYDLTNAPIGSVSGITQDMELQNGMTMERCSLGFASTGGKTAATAIAHRLRSYDGSVTVSDCVFTCGDSYDAPGLAAGYIACDNVTFDNVSCSGSLSTLTSQNKDFPHYTDAIYFTGMVGMVVDASREYTGNVTFRNCINFASYRIGLDDYYMTYDISAGGLAGIAYGSLHLENCMNVGHITLDTTEDFTPNCGGLVGTVGMQGKRATQMPINIIRCENRGDITGFNTGGLIGNANTPSVLSITDCKNTGKITGYAYGEGARPNCGGLVGAGNCDFYNCVNTGAVSGDHAGGLLGYYSLSDHNANTVLSSNASYCSNTGSISATTNAAGLIVRSGTSVVEDCYVSCRLSGSYVGGIAYQLSGRVLNCVVRVTASGDNTCFGGAVAYVDEARIEVSNCLITADVTTGNVLKSGYIGGVVGRISSYGDAAGCVIYNCAADLDASVTSVLPDYTDTRYDVGGILGWAEQGCEILKCYATGSIDLGDTGGNSVGGTVGSTAGGIVGGIYKDYSESVSSGTIGQCWSDMSIYHAEHMGGIVGKGASDPLYVYGCYSSSDLHGYEGQHGLGGLVGTYYNFVMQDSTFIGTISSPYTDFVGGLVGGPVRWKTADSRMINCYYVGNIVNTTVPGTMMGGLAGNGGSFANCWFEGQVCGNGLYTDSLTHEGRCGGIAGHAEGSMENCRVSGKVSNAYAGGLAGTAAGNIYNCRSDAEVSDCITCDENCRHYIGGLVGLSYCDYIVGCEVTRKVDVTSWDVACSRIGGIAGENYGQYVVDTVSAGVSASSYGEYEYLDVGGIVGYNVFESFFENCTVNGNVYACGSEDVVPEEASIGVVTIGGILGTSDEESVWCSGCTVNGSVTGYWHGNEDMASGCVTIGGLVGSLHDDYNIYLTAEACSVKGAIIYPPEHSVHDYEMLGYGLMANLQVPEVVLPEKPVENYTIVVKGIDPMTGEMKLLQGATVKVLNKTMTTDINGQVRFDSTDARAAGIITISVTKDGYFDKNKTTFLAHESEMLIIMEKLQENKIYITGADYLEDGNYADVLYNINTVLIPVRDRTGKAFKVTMDWNDSIPESRILYLGNADGSFEMQLIDGTVTYVPFSELYDIGEEIYLYAQANFEGLAETVKVKHKVNIKVFIGDVHLWAKKGNATVGTDGNKDDNSQLYFMMDTALGLGFDDLGPYAGQVTVKNGYLTAKFGVGVTQDDTIPVFKKGKVNMAVDANLSGEVGINIERPDLGEWFGDVIVEINNDFDVDTEQQFSVKYNAGDKVDGLMSFEYPFTIMVPGVPTPIPCFLETTLGVGGHASIGFKGKFDKAIPYGEIGIVGYGAIFGGAGGSAGDLEAKIGGEGSMRTDVDVIYEQVGDTTTQTLTAEFTGLLSAKGLVKAYGLDLEVKLKLGHYHWDPENGADWSLFGFGSEDEAQLQSISGQWSPVRRVSNGNFYRDAMKLLSFSSDGASSLRYDNIGEISESAMGVENGQVVLYFTADDGQGTDGTAAEHTALYRTVQNSDGSWSSPTVISTGGYPASPNAHNNAVVWVESSRTDSLENMMASTDVKVAIDGAVSATFPGNGYVYAPKVSTYGSRITVSWLSDPELDGTSVLYYAYYSGGSWSEPEVVETEGNPVSSHPSAISGYIFYSTDQSDVYRSYGRHIASDTTAFGLCDYFAAGFDEYGTLTLYYNNNSCGSFSTGYARTQSPVVMGSGSTCYVLWPEASGIRYVMTDDSGRSWTEPVLLCMTSQLPRNISAAVSDGTLLVSYYLTEEGVTSLYTAKVTPNALDLVVSDAVYSMEDYLEKGSLTINGKVFNNSAYSANGFTVDVTDEAGTLVYTNQFTKALNAGTTSNIYVEFVPDGLSGHTYTLSVMPLVDELDKRDNSIDVVLPGGAAEISDASFEYSGLETVRIQALVRNVGAAPTDMMVEITDAVSGAVLASQSYTEVYMGSYRQLLLEDVQPGCYGVNVYIGGELADTLQMTYVDPNAAVLNVRSLTVTSAGAAALELEGSNNTTGAKLVLALYDSGKMVACGTTQLAQLNGNQNAGLTLDQPVAAGSYSYKLFILANDGTLTPLMTPRSGSITVS